MSQGDYLKYKKISRELKINKLKPILNEDDYIQFKEYDLENKFINTKLTYNKLLPPNTKNIFDIEKKNTGNCPTFIVCNNTNTRSNRKLLLSTQFTPTPLRPLLQKNTNLYNTDLCECSKI